MCKPETMAELNAREIPTPTERHWWQRGYEAGYKAGQAEKAALAESTRAGLAGDSSLRGSQKPAGTNQIGGQRWQQVSR